MCSEDFISFPFLFIYLIIYFFLKTPFMSSSLVDRKPKLTPLSVCGSIVVTSEAGERVGQWGGTECYLTKQVGLGPTLLVRSSRHKKGAGTFFALSRVQRILSSFVHEGKLTLFIQHAHAGLCMVLISTTLDVDELFVMASTITDKSKWASIERVVFNGGSKRNREGNHDQLRPVDAVGGSVGKVPWSGTNAAAAAETGRARSLDGSLVGFASQNSTGEDDDDDDEKASAAGSVQRLPWVVKPTWREKKRARSEEDEEAARAPLSAAATPAPPPSSYRLLED